MSQEQGIAVVAAPGVYDLPSEDYFADPCPEPSLSSSIIKLLLSRSPLHARTEHPRLTPPEPSVRNRGFDIGSAAHALLLHAGRTIVEVKANDWRTDAAKAKWDEAAEAGMTAVLSKDLARAHAMVEACLQQLREHQASDAFRDGKGEQTLVWREPNGVWCRALVDWLPNRRREGMVLTDYKTTGQSAHQAAWGSRTLWNLGFDIQDALYRRGASAVFNVADVGFRFVIQEQEPPHAINVVELTPEARVIPDRDVERAIVLWGQCLRRNLWPGYPNRTHYIEAPAWVEHQRLEREAETPASPDMLAAMIDFQAP